MDRQARFRFRRQVPFGGQVTPVCSPRLLAESKHPLAEPSDLGHYAVLYLDDPHAGWFDWNLCFHALGLRDFRPAGRLHFSHYDQMIQAAVNGQGMALGLDPSIRQLVREGTLIAPFRKDGCAGACLVSAAIPGERREPGGGSIRRLVAGRDQGRYRESGEG